MSKTLKTKIAREFRKNPTPSEKILWSALRDRKFKKLKFRRQYLIEGFVIDFYCAEMKLAIEIDGEIHRRHITDDMERQKVLENLDIKFYRVKSGSIESNLGKVLEELEKFIFFLTLAPSPSPSSIERGREDVD